MTLHCAQRGCLIPDGTPAIEGGLCPTCNNPLRVVQHDENDNVVGEAEVSHEKLLEPPDLNEDQEDFTAGIDEDDGPDDTAAMFDASGNPIAGLVHAPHVEALG